MKFQIYKVCVMAILYCFLFGSYVGQAAEVKGAKEKQKQSISVILTPPVISTTVTAPIKMVLHIKNGSTLPLQVSEPSVLAQTVEIRVLQEGKKVGPLIIRDGPYLYKMITLAAGKSIEFPYDLSQDYSGNIKPGSYEVQMVYHFNINDSVSSNTVKLEIAPLSEEDKKIFAASLKVFGAGENATVARLGQEFLAKYPNSPFSNQVRLEIALTLIKVGQQDQAIVLYKQILESNEPRDWVKQQAQSYLWQAYADKGDIESAIAVLEKIGGDYARDYIAFVKRLNGRRIFEPPPPPDRDEAKPPSESINQMDGPEEPEIKTKTPPETEK